MEVLVRGGTDLNIQDRVRDKDRLKLGEWIEEENQE